jgi:DNA polymerase elongation subunit (family B)
MSNYASFPQNILFIDIETAAEKKSYDELSPRAKDAWVKKSALIDESSIARELYSQKAGIYAEFGKTIAIGVGFFYTDSRKKCFKVKCFHGHDEKKLLQEFSSLVETTYEHKKLFLCAHNGKEFDFPFLCRRMLINDLVIPKPLQLMGKKPWEVNHYDTLEMWKFGDRKNYTSLELLTTIFHIPGSKTDIDGSQVNRIYYEEHNGMERIALYCMNDVVATAQIFLKLHNKPLIDNENIIKI